MLAEEYLAPDRVASKWRWRLGRLSRQNAMTKQYKSEALSHQREPDIRDAKQPLRGNADQLADRKRHLRACLPSRHISGI